jgi:hypothetical protein
MQADVLAAAEDNGVCVMTSPMSAYEICCAIGKMAEE